MTRGTRISGEQLNELRRRVARRGAQDGPAPPASAAVTRAPAPRSSKYGVEPVYVAGLRYDSRAEANHAIALELRRDAGEVAGYRRQVPIAAVKMHDGRIAFGEVLVRCTVDFEVTRTDGTIVYEEVKGVRVRDWPVRERALLAAGVPLVVHSTRRKRKR